MQQPVDDTRHEIDHLRGKLIIDQTDTFGRLNNSRVLVELVAEFERKKKNGELPPDLEAVP